jgi:hypothetical protein
MEACYGGTDVMERSCAVARGIDINSGKRSIQPQKTSNLESAAWTRGRVAHDLIGHE